jgi:hypothetical protein
VHGEETRRDRHADRRRVRRREPVAAGDEPEQDGERDPARDPGGVDLGREVAALARVVEGVRDVGGDEQQGGATERGAGQRARRGHERAPSSTSGLTGVGGCSPFSTAIAF